jgi:hypothetical protein
MNPADITMYNSSNIFIYIEKYDDDLKKHVGTSLNMTWEAIRFDPFILEI